LRGGYALVSIVNHRLTTIGKSEGMWATWSGSRTKPGSIRWTMRVLSASHNMALGILVIVGALKSTQMLVRSSGVYRFRFFF